MTRLVTDSNPDGTNASPLALLVGCGCHVPAPDRVVTQPQAKPARAYGRRPGAGSGPPMIPRPSGSDLTEQRLTAMGMLDSSMCMRP
jgi:hypothetical protein